MSISFRLPDEDQSISIEEARWLLGQVRSSRELTSAAAAAAEKIERSLAQGSAVEPALDEQGALIDALERGSPRPRSRELRRLEIALHAAVYSQTYDQQVRHDAETTTASEHPAPETGNNPTFGTEPD